MNEKLTIHIPYNLARFAVWQRKLVTTYETNAIIKALDTWLVLKHETRSGYLHDWNKQKNHLLAICKISESVFRHRLRMLKQLGLLEYDRVFIRVCSWLELGTRLQIDTKQKFHLQYDVTDNQRVQEWLIATEIKDNQNRQAYMVIKNLNHHPIMYNEVVKAVVQAGADPLQLKNASYFLMWMKILYRDDFVRASAIHSILTDIRPDTNRGVKGMANAWKCKDPTTVSYWKHKLQRSKIIDISKVQILSQERVRNPNCKVHWLPSCKNSPLRNVTQTLLCLCDQISILTHWTASTAFTNHCKDNTDNANSCSVKLFTA